MAENSVARIAREKALPFEPLVPNNETKAAIKAARRGNFTRSFETVDDLMGHLRAED